MPSERAQLNHDRCLQVSGAMMESSDVMIVAQEKDNPHFPKSSNLARISPPLVFLEIAGGLYRIDNSLHLFM